MGRLIPDDFDITSLEKSEQRVVQSFVDGTSPDWLILPTINFHDNDNDFDGEVDLVLIHPARGIAVIETKGGVISVRDGSWFSYERRLKRSPVEQARVGKHALIKKIKGGLPSGLGSPPFLVHAVAFPDIDHSPAGDLTTDLEQRMVFTKRELLQPKLALELLMRKKSPKPQAMIDAVVKVLRPDLEFSEDLDGTLRWAQRRLSDETSTLIRLYQGLDENKQIKVDGPAGTGKTRLALEWTQRAINREERVLLFCFNEAMGKWLAGKFEDHPLVTAGPFFPTMEALLQPTGFEEPEKQNKKGDYYRTTVTSALLQYIDQIPQRFDTIVIDEVQDCHSDW
ncbi:MAG: hypothetical protein F2723_02160, partial [Actinobacteria bacterium]|nr:hypothetical protein [Actinomycetota bacterium]